MKLRLLVAVSAVLAFLSCQKSISENIEEPSSQNLVGTYDFVEFTSVEKEFMNDTINNVVSKFNTVDSNKSSVCLGTLQITAGQFIFTNIDVSGTTFASSVSEIEGYQPHFEEFTEEFGPYGTDSYMGDYTKLGLDSIRLTYIDPSDPSNPETESHHYRFSGDTLVLTMLEKKSYYVSEPDKKSSYKETFWQTMKFKRKK